MLAILVARGGKRCKMEIAFFSDCWRRSSTLPWIYRPSDKVHLPDVGWTLSQRHRRWVSVWPTSGRRSFSAVGWPYLTSPCRRITHIPKATFPWSLGCPGHNSSLLQELAGSGVIPAASGMLTPPERCPCSLTRGADPGSCLRRDRWLPL